MPRSKKDIEKLEYLGITCRNIRITNPMGKRENSGDRVSFINAKTPAVSKQPVDQALKGMITPPVGFYALRKAYDDSFILGGIFDKLSAAGDSGFKETGNPELDSILRSIDMRKVFENLLVYGNVFFEKVLDGTGKVAALYDILTETMSVWRLNEEEGYVQTVSGRRMFFLLDEILHSKTTSIVTKFYGESKFSKAIDQIILLAQIDQYYSRLFNQGLMSPCLIMDKGDQNGKKLSAANRAALDDWLEDNVGGVKNAFKTAVVPTELARLELDRNIDTKAFLEYRSALIESIAIALNIPVELLMPKSSNRATAEVAYAILNNIIVKPMQGAFIRDLKESLRGTFGASVDAIELNPVDSKDDEKEMKVLTGYKTSGILTANEVREKIGLAAATGGDVLEVSKAPASTDSGSSNADQVAKEVDAIQKSLQSLYDSEH